MKLRARAVVVAALVVTAGTALAEPEVTVTSPVDGASVSRSATPVLPVAGTAAFDEPVAQATTFYLRRSACASGDDDARLSTEAGGSSEQSGCGFIAQPANEVLIQAGEEPLSNNYATADGMPLTLDATQPITGALKVGGGVGVVTTELTLTAVTATTPRRTVTLGTASKTFNGTLGAVAVDFSMTPPAELDKTDLASMNLQVLTRGVNVQSGSIDHRNGVSRFDVPSYSTSFTRTVEFALSAAFTGARKATLAEDGTWSGSLPTPAVGSHTLYVRAVQGGARTEAAPVAFTVTP